MLSDTQTITVNAVAQAMPRLPPDGPTTVYQKSDQTFSLSIRHTSLVVKGKRRLKHFVSFMQRAIVPDPLTSVNDYETCSISIQIDRPEAGFTATQIDQMVAGFKTWLDTTTVTKLYGREA